MTIDEVCDLLRRGGSSDIVSDVDSVKVTVRQVSVDSFQIDVVGIEQEACLPVELGNSVLSGCPGPSWIGSNNEMLPVGLVPHWSNGDSFGRQHLKSPELGCSLVCETVADPEGEFIDSFHW